MRHGRSESGVKKTGARGLAKKGVTVMGTFYSNEVLKKAYKFAKDYETYVRTLGPAALRAGAPRLVRWLTQLLGTYRRPEAKTYDRAVQ